MRKQIGNTWIEALQGVFEIGSAFATPFLRSRRRRWGMTDEEIAATYPGDDLVPEPKWTANHAISINATPKQVWPWIAQIGQGRGGFYSYEKLENIADCKIVNTARILDEFQNIQVGEKIKLGAEIPPMSATVVTAPTTLVVYGNPSGDDEKIKISSTWAFLLLEQPDGTTKFLSRTRYFHGDNLLSKLLGGPLLMEPISFVMERKMLRVVKALAESNNNKIPFNAETLSMMEKEKI